MQRLSLTLPPAGLCLQVLDSLEPLERNPLAPIRMPIVDRWKDMGTMIMGKSESGFIRVGDVLQRAFAPEAT